MTEKQYNLIENYPRVPREIILRFLFSTLLKFYRGMSCDILKNKNSNV